MTDAIHRLQQSIRPPGIAESKPASSQQNTGVKTNFKELFDKEQTKISNELKFSAHAQNRLQERNIVMSPENNSRLNQAVNRILEKGGKESLVLMDDLAFVVSAQNKTVITAMDNSSIKNNVFTNIDSAVIV